MKENTKQDAWGNTWTRIFPVSQEQITDLEKMIGVPISEELKTLWLHFNGGRPEKSYFANKEIEVGIGFILPIYPPTSYKGETFLETREYIIKQGYSDEYIPFAIDNGNAGIFCLHRNEGEVFYCVNSPEDPIKKVSSSLTELLSHLQDPPF